MDSEGSSFRGWRLVAVSVLVVALGLAAYRQLTEMDERFFRRSGPAAKGLARYLVGDYAGAARAYREDLRQDLWSSGQPGASDMALVALARGKLDAAAELARGMLARNAGDRSARLTLAEVALQRGEPGETLTQLEPLRERADWDYDVALLSAVAHARSGAPGPAIDLLRRVLRTGWTEHRLTSFLQALELTGEFAGAPARERPVCLLAHLHRYLRILDPSHARPTVRYAREAIARGDRPADAYVTIGIVYDKQGYPDDALAAFLKAVEHDPRHGEALRLAALLYADRGDLPNEYRMIKRAYEAWPDDHYYVGFFGNLLIDRLGDIHQARAVWEQAVRDRPRDARALERLGEVEMFLGDHARAIELLEAARRLAPTDLKIHWRLGNALLDAHREDEAVAVFRRYVELAPRLPSTHTNLAGAYGQAKQYGEAIRELEEAFRLGERSIVHREYLCELYFYETTDFPRMAECFRRVLAADPRNARALYLLPSVEKNLRLARERRS